MAEVPLPAPGRPAGRAADVIELQAQSLERDAAAYASFVSTATSQAVAANPGVAVLAGLSTNPPGAPVDGQHLAAAIHAGICLADCGYLLKCYVTWAHVNLRAYDRVVPIYHLWEFSPIHEVKIGVRRIAAG